VQLIKEVNVTVGRKMCRRNGRAYVKNLMDNKVKWWTYKGRN